MFLRDLEQPAQCWPCLEPRVGPDYLQSPFHSVSCYERVYKYFHEKHFLLPATTYLLLTAEVFLNYSGTCKSREYWAENILCESSSKNYLIMSFYICWEISLYKALTKHSLLPQFMCITLINSPKSLLFQFCSPKWWYLRFISKGSTLRGDSWMTSSHNATQLMSSNSSQLETM